MNPHSDPGPRERLRERGDRGVSRRARRISAGSWVAAAMGLLLLLPGLGASDPRTLFAYLAAWTFGTSVCIGALVFLMVGHIAKAGWMVVTRRAAEAIASALPLYLLLFAPIARGLGRLYPWAAPEHAGTPSLRHALAHTRPYLNPPFFLVRTLVYFAVFIAVAGLLSAWSLQNDRTPRLALVLRMRRLSAGALPVIALALTWAAFDWTMSLEPEWSSTIFGMYVFAGAFVSGIALVILALAFSRGGGLSPNPRLAPGPRLAPANATDGERGERPWVTPDHAQALGRVLFAMVIFWAYMALSQLVIYWMGDIPDEIEYYRLRTAGSWSAVTALLVFGHFFFPFAALLSRHRKRDLRYLAGVAGWVFFMHYVDVYWMVLPNHDRTGIRLSWQDVATVLLFGGVSCAWITRRYAAHARLPARVPELESGMAYEAAL